MDNNLKAIRRQKCLPIAAVAVMARMGTGTIIAIERHGHNPRTETRQRLADALGVSVESIWPAPQLSTTDMENLKQVSSESALNDMMIGSCIYISTIDKVALLLGVDHKDFAYDILSALDGVEFFRMPPYLRKAIPGLIEKCLGNACWSIRYGNQ